MRAGLGDSVALEDCEEATQFKYDYANDRQFLENRGRAHAALGDKTAALADWQTALTLTPPADRATQARLEKLVRSVEK